MIVFPKISAKQPYVYLSLSITYLFFFLSCEKSQREKQIEIAERYFEQGQLLKITGPYDSAQRFFRKSVSIYRSYNYDEQVLLGYNGMVYSFLNEHRYDSAKKYLDILFRYANQRNLNHAYPLSKSYHQLGIWYLSSMTNYDSSFYYLNKALKRQLDAPRKNKQDISASYNSLGTYYGKKNDIKNALSYTEKAIKTWEESGAKNNDFLGYSFYNIAFYNSQMGDYGQAISYLKKAAKVFEEKFPEGHSAILNTYNEIGYNSLKLKRHKEALNWFTKVIGMANEQTHPVVIADAHLFKAEALGTEDEKTMDNFREALKIKSGTLGATNMDIATIYNKMGKHYHQAKVYDSARHYFRKACDISLQLHGGKTIFQSRILNAWGNMEYDNGNLESALEKAYLSTKALTHSFDSMGFSQNPPIDSLDPKIELYEALFLKGKAFEAQGSRKHLEQALKVYQLADEIINKIKKDYVISEVSKLFMEGKSSNLYDHAIQTSCRLYRLTQEPIYKEKIFEFAEKNRNNVLLSNLIESKAKKFSGIPESLLHKEHQLKVDLAFYKSLLYQEDKKAQKNHEKISSYEKKVFELNRSHKLLVKNLESNYPKYYKLKQSNQQATVQETQNRLAKGQLVIEYFMGKENLVILLFSPTDYEVINLPKQASLEKNIEKLYKSINKYDKESFPNLSFQLYQQLIQPIKSYLKGADHLFIIPHEEISHVSFESLIQQPATDSPTNYEELDYLIKSHSISYHYSATLLIENIGRDTSAVGLTAFAPVFANNRDKKNNAPEPLPESQKEVEAIVDLFKKKRQKATLYLHEKASESQFKKASANCRYVHLATHTLLVPEKPEFSATYFSEDGSGEQGNDGMLTSAESYNLDLNAELLVLSSCESGFGKLVQGEGMLSITRGFYYSGAENIICSLWKVNDKSTKNIMIKLYEHLLMGESKAKSLQKAKLSLIHDPIHAFPKNWAGFILFSSIN